MNEFDIIRRFFDRPVAADTGVSLGIGDDAAVVRIPAGQELVLAMDTLVNGVHFPENTSAAAIGWKALAVNLSDLAAMGAKARWATLSLTMPEADEAWLAAFAGGFFELAQQYDVHLIGGDLCRGPLAVTIQVHGLVPAGQAIRRCGAAVGDVVYVTGTLGDAGYALHMPIEEAAGEWFRLQLQRPEPRLTIGQALRGLATSAIDISDGLAGDLEHILRASGVGAELSLDSLPLSPSLETAVGRQQAVAYALTAGDDYELCFTAPSGSGEAVQHIATETGVAITAIGRIQADSGLRLGNSMASDSGTAAYRHFS